MPAPWPGSCTGIRPGPENPAARRRCNSSLKGCTGQELLDRLQERAKASEGWQVRQLQRVPGAIAGEAAKPPAPAPLACRTPIRRLAQVWRIGSFSHLTAQSGHDPEEREPEAAGNGPAEEAVSAEREEPFASVIPLAQFPKGPVAGKFLSRPL